MICVIQKSDCTIDNQSVMIFLWKFCPIPNTSTREDKLTRSCSSVKTGMWYMRQIYPFQAFTIIKFHVHSASVCQCRRFVVVCCTTNLFLSNHSLQIENNVMRWKNNTQSTHADSLKSFYFRFKFTKTQQHLDRFKFDELSFNIFSTSCCIW